VNHVRPGRSSGRGQSEADDRRPAAFLHIANDAIEVSTGTTEIHQNGGNEADAGCTLGLRRQFRLTSCLAQLTRDFATVTRSGVEPKQAEGKGQGLPF
jgi:hypothetical protein